MKTGTIKWLSPKHVYGFIEQDSGRADIFVKVSAMTNPLILGLANGHAIRYDIAFENDRPVAHNMRLIVAP